MSATALVTGANGFVGSHLVDHLLERGWKVRCLVRRTSDLRWLPEDEVEMVFGSLSNGEGLSEAANGVDYVFHGAAVTRAPRESVYFEVNAGGTRRLLESISGGVKRFVQVSSLAAGGPSAAGAPRKESDADAPTGFYGRSKLEAERMVREAGDIPWTIVRPPSIYGSRDRDFLKLALMARRGWTFRLSGNAQELSVIHVSDLVRGLVEAAESPATAGRTYYLSQPGVTTWAEMGKRMGTRMGLRVRTLTVPRGLVPAVSRTAGVFSGLAGRPNPLPPDRIQDLLAEAWTCDSSRAREEFGFETRLDLKTGLKQTVDWYLRRGWL